ncbi:MAG: hypothetical protein KAH48_01615 [Chlorobi bacterium]|nr:hypothetical protein [Chlorobiota bacterium]
MDEKQNKLAVFQGTEVRRAWYKEEWYYSLVDIIAVLTDSANPTDYLKKIRRRDDELKFYIGTNCPRVGMQTATGKQRTTLAGNTKDVFRLIQSVPSTKAEPFKQWLAKLGKERLDEIENPGSWSKNFDTPGDHTGFAPTTWDNIKTGIHKGLPLRMGQYQNGRLQWFARTM